MCVSLRFDAGGWFRYDDTNVTETNEESVRYKQFNYTRS